MKLAWIIVWKEQVREREEEYDDMPGSGGYRTVSRDRIERYDSNFQLKERIVFHTKQRTKFKVYQEMEITVIYEPQVFFPKG